MSMSLMEALMRTMWATWADDPPPDEPNGNRVFMRWVDITPGEEAWDDWDFVAMVTPNGLKWLKDGNSDDTWDIGAAIAAGKHHGRLTEGVINVEWCRSSLDGPPVRVVDWLGQPEDARD